MVASAVLTQPDRLGDATFLAVGPAVIFVALIGWVTLVLTTSRKLRHYPTGDDGLPHRGPVMGGVIMGDPSQLTRRDAAPSVTQRAAVPAAERERAQEAARTRERPETRRAKDRRAETRRAEKRRAGAESPARSRRRFGLPRLR